MAIVVLVLNPEGGEGTYLELEPRSYLIGRMEEADIELDSPTISRRHARLFPMGGEWYLEDLGSRNGSSVNGSLTRSARLQEGDLFGIGPMTAFFFTESSIVEVEDLRQNFPRLKEMALRYSRDLATANKPLMAPSEKIPVTKARPPGLGLGKNLTLLSDIASGKIKKGS